MLRMLSSYKTFLQKMIENVILGEIGIFTKIVLLRPVLWSFRCWGCSHRIVISTPSILGHLSQLRDLLLIIGNRLSDWQRLVQLKLRVITYGLVFWMYEELPGMRSISLLWYTFLYIFLGKLSARYTFVSTTPCLSLLQDTKAPGFNKNEQALLFFTCRVCRNPWHASRRPSASWSKTGQHGHTEWGPAVCCAFRSRDDANVYRPGRSGTCGSSFTVMEVGRRERCMVLEWCVI